MGQPHSITMDDNVPEVAQATVTDGNNKALKLKISQNRLILDLKELPQYITLMHGIMMK